jgi:hypothetical protein
VGGGLDLKVVRLTWVSVGGWVNVPKSSGDDGGGDDGTWLEMRRGSDDFRGAQGKVNAPGCCWLLAAGY